MYVKICGITRRPDRDAALTAGASALGFIAYPKSPRFIPPETVASLVADMPEGIDRVCVFVNADLKFIQSYLDAGITTVQLHGEETPDFIDKVSALAHVWKAAGLRSVQDLTALSAFSVERYVIDAYSKTDYGGTGKQADWTLAAEAVNHLPRPVLLAGGLTCSNVEEAINRVNPWGIDLSSGVEVSPGIKDHSLIQAFMTAVNKATTTH